jgi:hypothetical protein
MLCKYVLGLQHKVQCLIAVLSPEKDRRGSYWKNDTVVTVGSDTEVTNRTRWRSPEK